MDVLNGEPVIELSGDEFLPVEGKTFIQQVEEFFQKQGGVAHSAFGDVILDKKGIRNDFHHGMSLIKRASFAAVKDVLECGIIILQLDYYHTNNKKQMTGMIAAPIKISDERYVCVVEVIANTNKQRLYLHEAFLIKNLQEIVATSPVHDNNIITSRQPQGENLFEDAASNSVHGSETTSPHPQGEIAKVLQNYVSANKNILNDKIRLYDQENGTELARFVAFLERGKVYEGNESRFFRIGKTGELLQKYGMKGDITIGSSPFNERHSKDGHDLSIEDWISIARNINHPIAISKYTKRKMSYRIYVSARINGSAACVGTDVHSLGKNIEVTNISTVFWRDMEKAGQGEFEKLLYPET